MTNGSEIDQQTESVWRHVLTHGHRNPFAFLPGSARCTSCNVAMSGFGGKIVQAAFGIRSSRKNPNFCNLCDDKLPQGGAEVDVAVLFADVRGSTGLAEKTGAKAFAALMNRFYDAASQALLPHRAMIDKMVGDEVVGLFFPVAGPGYRAGCVHAAVSLMRLLGYRSGQAGWIPVGIGLNAGTAFCGRVGAGEVRDFTALGDTVNTGARLQAQAQPGEILMSEDLYREVEKEYPNAEPRSLQLRGRTAVLQGRVLRV